MVNKSDKNTGALQLNSESLPCLGQSVSAPTYNRDEISPGIVHIGVGNFHRAHQAFYLDQLFNLGVDHDWGIIGAGIKSFDQSMRQRLAKQDCLYTVVEVDPHSDIARVCGAMIDFVPIDPQLLIQQLSDPVIRIVSLTITEGGYYRDEKNGEFNRNHAEIVADAQHPETPKTVFGILLAALLKRRQQSLPPFTIMSCDNLPHNGFVTQQALVGLAKLQSKELASWVESEVSCPNGMVDCITPATGARERDLVAEKFGIDDQCPVVCEPYRQWVLEDRFPQGRPQLEKVGVEFVDDVAPYELMKLRLLNGGHAMLSYPAALLGIDYVHQAMENKLVSGFIAKVIKNEVIPILPSVEGFDSQAYVDKVEQRFSNTKIGDTIGRLCMDGSNRQPKFILPSIADRLALGLAVPGLAMEVALWCRYCAMNDEAGRPVQLFDENDLQLRQRALLTREQPLAFIEIEAIFGSVSANAEFANTFTDSITSLWQNGVTATLEDYLSE
jgi:mannitol 2-dehydrogenase